MITVVGLDLSYTRTGLTILKRKVLGSGKRIMDFRDEVEPFRFKTTNENHIYYRTNAISSFVKAVLYENLGMEADLIVCESAAFGGCTGPMMHALNITVGTMVYADLDIDLLLVPPRTLKRFIGVKGKQKREITKIAIALTGVKMCNDEADAYFLAKLGADYLTIKKGGASVVSDLARDILFCRKLNKKGKLKGLALRDGEFFIRKGS